MLQDPKSEFLHGDAVDLPHLGFGDRRNGDPILCYESANFRQPTPPCCFGISSGKAILMNHDSSTYYGYAK